MRLSDRQFIGKQPFVRQFWCCGRTDEAGLLSEIGGWAIGCANDTEHYREVSDLKARGLITTRRHVAPAGEWDAYALTEAGFNRLAKIGYGTMHDSALKSHRFYEAAANPQHTVGE